MNLFSPITFLAGSEKSEKSEKKIFHFFERRGGPKVILYYVKEKKIMSQINPKKILADKVFIPAENWNPKEQIQQVGIDVTLKLTEPYELKPLSFVNLDINEGVDLPDNIYSTLNIRSSFSRKGIFQSSGIYDPGFHGTCGLSLYNLSDKSIIFEPNQRIAQMVFFDADAASVYDGHYNHTDSSESQYK